MKKQLKLLLIGATLLSCSAWALTIDEAKSQGRVGETFSGYLAAVKQDKETLAFVDKINDARKGHYQSIAEKNNIRVDDVAKMAGTKLVDRANAGEFVRGVNGQWVQKK